MRRTNSWLEGFLGYTNVPSATVERLVSQLDTLRESPPAVGIVPELVSDVARGLRCCLTFASGSSKVRAPRTYLIVCRTALRKPRAAFPVCMTVAALFFFASLALGAMYACNRIPTWLGFNGATTAALSLASMWAVVVLYFLGTKPFDSNDQ